MLANIENSDKISHVMLNGRLYEVASMNEVGATPKARKPFFFEGKNGAKLTVEAIGRGKLDCH